MGLGDKFLAWLRTLPVVGSAVKYLDEFSGRWNESTQLLPAVFEACKKTGNWQPFYLFWATSLAYDLFGGQALTPASISSLATGVGGELEAFYSDPQGFTQRKLHEFGTSPSAIAFAEFVGTVVTEPVLSLLEDMATQEKPDPHDFARRFHGIASGLPWASQTLDALFKTLLGDRAPQVGNSIMSLYWGLGLGFLGWQTLAPLLSTGLQPNLQRYYNRLYHPERFNPSQAMDLYALGKLSKGDFYNVLLDQGWRAEDVSLWIEQSYRTLSGGELWDLYHNGTLDKAEMDRRLRALGYNPADLPLLYKSNEKEETKDAPRYLMATLKQSFLEDRLGEDELRQIMASMNFAAREIDLYVTNLLVQKADDGRSLTTAQIHTLYKERVIGRDEAIHALRELDYSAQIAGQLVQAWDNLALPKASRINKSTILEGYTGGALGRDEATGLLEREAGYTPEKAELLLRIEEAGVKAKVTAPTVKGVGLSTLADFVESGLITREDLAGRAELAQYSAADRARLVDMLFLQAQVKAPVVELPEATLKKAFVAGVLSRDQLLARLQARGLSPEDAAIVVATTEAEHPEVFAEAAPKLLKQPSVGALQLTLQRGLIDEAAFRDKLAAQGYSAEAAEIFLLNAQYQAPAEPKQLTKADVMKLFREGVIGRAEAQRRLIALGYTAVDVELLVKSERALVEDTEAAEWFSAGLIDTLGATTIWTSEGYTPDEIEGFLARFVAGEFG